MHKTQLSGKDSARCPRCDALLYRNTANQIERICALTLAALITFVIAQTFPILEMDVNGMRVQTTLLGALEALWNQDMQLVAVMVFCSTLLFPLIEMAALLYVLLAKARKEGTLTLEADIDDPEKSPIFTQYPKILADKHMVEFLTDYLRLMVGGNMNAFEIESLMDEEIETHHVEVEGPAHALTRVGDAMPAFGIVAAVMGVVHTMASADKPPAVLGAMIAQALVGTFLGILLSYGLIGPLASLAEQRAAESTKLLQCIKVTILASLNGYAPAIAVEFGRKVLFSTERPSFAELEEHVRRVKAK
ncbi:paraquat-inducible protein A [Burkholderia gladioli]|uniref:paraquat-inducible protein A n=1 Tax=Burkholderia gladioli TaxID=28095 RepID=UPI00355B9566